MKSPLKYWPYLTLLILSLTLSLGYLTHAQEDEEQGQKSEVQALAEPVQSRADEEDQMKGRRGGSVGSVVINFVELARRKSFQAIPLSEPKAIREPGPGPLPRPASERGPQTITEPEANRAATTPDAPQVASPAPASSFKALEDSGTSVPPDTHGAVGPYHLMVTHNTQLRIQSKTGGTLSTVTLNDFWAGLSITQAFDPRVLYDPYQKRWMITSSADPDSPTASLLIGVSQTSDPTGLWKLYKVDVDSHNALWADYPCLGFNKNWIVVTANMFTNAQNSFKHVNIYAFDKANLYAFGASANHTLFEDTTNGFSMSPAITYNNTLSTLYMVEDWDGSSQLRISSITGTPSAPAYSTTHKFPTTSDIWGFGPFGGYDILPQLGSNYGIQPDDSRMQTVVYRSGSLWCAHTIFLTSETRARSAVQWWQLSPTGTIQQRGRIDDESGQIFYAYPSIAVNKNKDVLIGFSRFSSQQYASANYAFRASTDPLNTLRGDVVLKAGSAPYYKTLTGTRNRWGDYSSTVVDPVNDLDMWTIQEYAAPVSGMSRWGTWWGRISLGPTQPAPDVLLGTLTARDTGSDADTVIEPGEGATLNVQLRNTGSGAATAVSAQLTTTSPGVTITSNASAYPDLAATSGTGMNATPFAFRLASNARCGQLLSFALTVTYSGGGSPRRLTFTIPTGNPGKSHIEKIRTGTPVKIGDPAGFDDPPVRTQVQLAVSGIAGNISDLNFKFGGTQCTAADGATTVGLDHTRVGDLSIKLTSPQGTVVGLMSRPGGLNNPGNNFCNTILDDETTHPSIQNISTTGAGAPYSNTYKPANPLSIFDGENPNGTWTLTVTDCAYGETGYVRTFSLIITPSECSTTASASPIEIRSDHALATLIADEPTPMMSFAQQSSLTWKPYLTALFAGIEAKPAPMDDELLRLMLNR
jgi:subtilisin-like proprotein convertase family protein